MRISKSGLSSFATRTLALWIAIAVASGLGAVVSWRLTATAAEQVTHTLIVQRQLARYLSAAQDVEIGHRGYLLTRDERFLEPYRQAAAEASKIHEELPSLVKDNPRQARLVNSLDATIRDRLVAIEKNLDALRSGKADAQPDASASAAGKKVLDSLRTQIAESMAEEQHLYDERSQRYRHQSLWLLATMTATLLSSAGLALLAWSRERERAAALETTALALTTANRTLEDRVQKRTEELAAERDRAEALLRDVTHRVGNSLALVVGFINLHIRHTDDPVALETLTGARDRVHAIASAQRRINVTNDLDLVRLDSLLDSVMKDVVTAVTDDPIVLRIDVQPLLAPAQLATSLCVLTQEFVVNALKHAFPRGEGGTITVKLAKIARNTAELTIEDDGRGMLTAAGGQAGKANGLGQKIATLLARQFNGDIRYSACEPGASRPGTRVTIKLSDIQVSSVEPKQEAVVKG